MQSETADLTPGAATWRAQRNIRVVFDSNPFAPLGENLTSSNRKYITYCVAIREGPSHGHR